MGINVLANRVREVILAWLLTRLVVSDYPGYYTALFGEGLGTLFFQFFFSLLTCDRTLAPNISNGELKIIMMILNDYIYNNDDKKLLIIIIPLVTFRIKHKVKQSHISEGNTYKES